MGFGSWQRNAVEIGQSPNSTTATLRAPLRTMPFLCTFSTAEWTRDGYPLRRRPRDDLGLPAEHSNSTDALHRSARRAAKYGAPTM